MTATSAEPARVSIAQRRGLLGLRHRLAPGRRTDDVVAIADDLVALHSTDPVTVFLSTWARMENPSLEAVERALYDDRTLVRHHAMRRTLWVAAPDTARLMHGAATRKLIGPEERRTLGMLAASQVPDPQGWLASARRAVTDLLRDQGPLSARQVGQHLPDLRVPLRLAVGKPYEGTSGAHTRVLLQLGFEGRVLRADPGGTWINGAYRYAEADQWLPGGLGELGETEAATALVDRWLRRFGPATTLDVAWWAGWTVTLTWTALTAAGARPVDLGDGPGWVAAPEDPDAWSVGAQDPEPWVAVLPGLDPTVMGWKERGWYLPATAAQTFDRYGNAGPTLWVDGQVVGAWAQAKDGRLRHAYVVDVPLVRRRELDAELARVADLLGPVRFSVRFPGRIQARLLAD